MRRHRTSWFTVSTPSPTGLYRTDAHAMRAANLQAETRVGTARMLGCARTGSTTGSLPARICGA
jgi:hypothetical protein